jgi:hypothetical protein
VEGKDDIEEIEWDDDLMDIQKDLAGSHDASPTDSMSELKRKREADEDPSSPKKTRLSTDELAPAPAPPPPPPPTDGIPDMDEEYASLGELGNINGKAAPQENGHPSPMQLATPSTNGSHQPESRAESGNGN